MADKFNAELWGKLLVEMAVAGADSFRKLEKAYTDELAAPNASLKFDKVTGTIMVIDLDSEG